MLFVLVILKITEAKSNRKSNIKHYTVQRKALENEMKFLCFSIQNNGSYNVHFPNIYYNAAEKIVERFCQQLKPFKNLPTERELKTVFMENDIPENEKGPGPTQFKVPFSADDESYTSSYHITSRT